MSPTPSTSVDRSVARSSLTIAAATLRGSRTTWTKRAPRVCGEDPVGLVLVAGRLLHPRGPRTGCEGDRRDPERIPVRVREHELDETAGKGGIRVGVELPGLPGGPERRDAGRRDQPEHPPPLRLDARCAPAEARRTVAGRSGSGSTPPGARPTADDRRAALAGASFRSCGGRRRTPDARRSRAAAGSPARVCTRSRRSVATSSIAPSSVLHVGSVRRDTRGRAPRARRRSGDTRPSRSPAGPYSRFPRIIRVLSTARTRLSVAFALLVITGLAIGASTNAATRATRAGNPIQRENALPGSPGWRLPRAAPGAVEGYASRVSVRRRKQDRSPRLDESGGAIPRRDLPDRLVRAAPEPG